MQKLRQGAAAADQTLAALRRHLPADLAGQVWGASVRNGVLTVLVGSAGWGTRLRYQAPRIRVALAGELAVAIERVLIRVRPPG